MNKVCVFSVIFPANLDYLNDYLQSLNKQLFIGFDILLFNDGVPQNRLNDLISDFNSLKFKICNVSGTIEEIRIKGIEYLKNSNYEKVVFCDTDDYFESNRIGVCVELLKSYDMIVNDLTIVSSSGKIIKERYFSSRLTDGTCVTRADLIDKNIFGFSNTSMNVSALSNIEPSHDITAIDWYFFSVFALQSDLNICFTNRTITFYRQHGSNIVGFDTIDTNRVLKAVDVKFQHYMALKRFDNYQEKFNGFNSLRLKLKQEDFRTRYINYVLSQDIKNPFWWEEALVYKDEDTINT